MIRMSSCCTAAINHISRAQAARMGSLVLPVDSAYMAPILSVLTRTRAETVSGGMRVLSAMTTFNASSCEI